MIHAYKYIAPFDAKFVESVKTFPQLRKREDDVFKSITSTLAFLPQTPVNMDGVFGGWLEWSCWKLGTEGFSYEETQRRKWKMREMPLTGEEVTSAEFGTAGHLALEHFNSDQLTNEVRAFSEWVDLWADWLLENAIQPLHSELQVADPVRRIAGTVDFVGCDPDGFLVVCDYKFRDGKIERKAREKDCIQLAWAAEVIKWKEELDYTPEAFSIIFDSETPRLYAKQWTQAAQQKGLKELDALNAWVTAREKL